MSRGSLLQRNDTPTVDVVVIEREIKEGTNDPLSSNFIIPTWVYTPWDLITYFQECLNELVLEGEKRTLIGGFSREIRPARKLLENGLDIAVRACRLTAIETFGNVTLYRALDRVEKIQQTRYSTD